MAWTAHPLDFLLRQCFRVAESCFVSFFIIINHIFLVSLLPAWPSWGLCQPWAEVEGCTSTIEVTPSAPTVLEEFRGSWVLPLNLLIHGDGVEQVILSAKLHHGGLVGNILDIFHWETGQSCTRASGLSCRKGSMQESPQSWGLCLAAHKTGYKN